MALFVQVDVAPELAKDAEGVKKLVEVCPVNIFAQADSGELAIVDENLDECTLCELCLEVGEPGAVRVRKLYDEGQVLERRA